MSLDVNLAPYPQIYVRIKLTVLSGSEPQSSPPKPWKQICPVTQLYTSCSKTKPKFSYFSMEMVSYLINIKTLLGLHFTSLFTKHIF